MKDDLGRRLQLCEYFGEEDNRADWPEVKVQCYYMPVELDVADKNEERVDIVWEAAILDSVSPSALVGWVVQRKVVQEEAVQLLVVFLEESG